jgi:hypothetical protein
MNPIALSCQFAARSFPYCRWLPVWLPSAGPHAGKAEDSPGQKGAPPGTRTPNPQIKSLLLCQLS